MQEETEDGNGEVTEGGIQSGIQGAGGTDNQESGLSVAEVAKGLSIPKSSPNNWVMAAKQGKLASIGRNQKPVAEMEMELSKLKRELAETRMERDFLK